jgi:putative PIN family toxin of toxin-antitoxin system
VKVLFDTNVLFPAWLYLSGVCAKAFNKAIDDEKFTVIVCTHTIEEFLRNCNKKFPSEMPKIQAFLSYALEKIKLVRTPLADEKVTEEELIRDVDDRLILRAAVVANVDIIVTGDKDFLEAGLSNIKVMSPAEFVNL